VTLDANEQFVPRDYFRVRQTTQTDIHEQFRCPKCVAPLEMPLGTYDACPRIKAPSSGLERHLRSTHQSRNKDLTLTLAAVLM
jgi:transcription initiation factor IIE alpha subunit